MAEMLRVSWYSPYRALYDIWDICANTASVLFSVGVTFAGALAETISACGQAAVTLPTVWQTLRLASRAIPLPLAVFCPACVWLVLNCGPPCIGPSVIRGQGVIHFDSSTYAVQCSGTKKLRPFLIDAHVVVKICVLFWTMNYCP